MDARTRVRQFLARGTADRAPFLAMATEYTARLAQCTVGELLADPGLFVRSFTESVTVLGLDAVLIAVPAPLASGPIAVPADLTSGPIAVPADLTSGPIAVSATFASGRDPVASAFAVLRENLHRLRATLRDQIALVALLPGPLTLAASLGVPVTPDSLDDLVTALITLQEYLGPAQFDALALLERLPVADPDVPALADAASAFWNVARYYSLPSLLIAARGTPRLPETGPTAVAAWSGVTAAELLAGGAAAAGQPPPPVPAPLPPGAFYLTAGEIPPGSPVDAVRSLVRSVSMTHRTC
jgi:hypothetical protein